MFTIDEFPGRAICIDGNDYLYFGGTSYLGLQTDPEFQALFIKNIKKYGTAYGASRKSNIRLGIFDEVETHLSNVVGSEACISVSSGYLAGQLVCDYFSQEDYQLYYAPNTHAALLRGQQRVYQNWEELEKAVHSTSNKTPVIFLDSIDFCGENYPDYKFLRNLPIKDSILVVDDSHGIGITGEEGGGSFSFLQSLKPKDLIVSCSLGKGFGVQAGAIFGSRSRIKTLTETHFFGGSSPATPASLATIKDAHQLILRKSKALNNNTALFLSGLSHTFLFSKTIGHPTFSFQNELLATQLAENNILVTNFKYPTENDAFMSRIVLSASHTTQDIKTLCAILNELLARN